MTNSRELLAYNIKERRRILGMTQEKLADKISTSTQYIGQIEQQNKFPSAETLERLAAALEIDSPQLFSMISFTDETLNRFQKSVQADLETTLAQAITPTFEARTPELKNTALKSMSEKG